MGRPVEECDEKKGDACAPLRRDGSSHRALACSGTVPPATASMASDASTEQRGAAASTSTALSGGSAVVPASDTALDEQQLLAAGKCTATKVTTDIEMLLTEQKRQRAERKRVAQDLKNAQKRRQRLTHRARLLSTTDLLTVVALRERDGVRAAEKGGRAAAAASDAEAAAAGTGTESREEGGQC